MATQTLAPPMSDTLALKSLPLFPLGTVLFPGGSLPLQIFEVRYLDMISKCHKAGAPFGVVSLTHGREVRQRAPGSPDGNAFVDEAFQSVGTLATITELSSPQAGLLVIRCTGTQRFRIESQNKLKHGLWIANVNTLADDQPLPIPDDLKNVATALANLINTLRARQVPPEKMPLHPPWRLDDCGWVANRWCELLPMPQDLRQRMMELNTPLVRLELISDMLERSGIAL